MDVHLNVRPVRPEDELFLRELRAQVDAERLGLQQWSPESLPLAGKLLDQQFRAHAAHYKTVKNNWDTKDCVIEFNGHLAGRFILTQDVKIVHLSDIAVHLAFRGLGIGQAVIQGVMGECEQSRRLLRLHVDPQNPAVQLYQRLGFRQLEERAGVWLLEWTPLALQGRSMFFDPNSAR